MYTGLFFRVYISITCIQRHRRHYIPVQSILITNQTSKSCTPPYMNDVQCKMCNVTFVHISTYLTAEYIKMYVCITKNLKFNVSLNERVRTSCALVREQSRCKVGTIIQIRLILNIYQTCLRWINLYNHEILFKKKIQLNTLFSVRKFNCFSDRNFKLRV